jgi:hypothetical protein
MCVGEDSHMKGNADFQNFNGRKSAEIVGMRVAYDRAAVARICLIIWQTAGHVSDTKHVLQFFQKCSL